MQKVAIFSFMLISLLYGEENVDDITILKKKIDLAQQEKEAAEKRLKELKAKLPQDTSLKTHTQFGYISTIGNTRTENFTLSTKWKKEFAKHKVSWILDAQYGKADDNEIYTTNKNKFFTELAYDYSLQERFTLNYLTGYKHDKFSNYTYQFYTGPGMKYKLFATAVHKLSMEGNILYSKDQYIESDKKTEYLSFQAKGVYSWQIFENLKFDESVSYRVELKETDNYFIYSDSELSSKISDIFSAGVGYKVDYVNKPGDKERTDRTFLVTLSVDY